MKEKRPPQKMTMKEINASKKKFTCVSFFSGCGGSSTGYKMAGFDVRMANEFVPAAQDTYKANHPKTILKTEDIRILQPKALLKELGMKAGDLDLLDLSPPCKGFSSAGVKEKNVGKEVNYSGGIYQRVDDLFDEAIRMIKGFKPKVFVAENVPGMISGDSKGFFIEVHKQMQALGYVVEARIIDPSYLGVPQARRRLIFVGVRKDLKLSPAFPKKGKRRTTVKEVLPNIAYLKHKVGTTLRYVPATRPSPTITVSDAICYETAKFSSGGFIKTDSGDVRKYTIEELKVIFSFPEDFKLTGSFKEQWERLGRSHAPVAVYHVARTIRKEILEKVC